MKKYLIGGAFALAAFASLASAFAGSANAGLWTALKNSGLPVKESKLYRIEDPSGFDLRVYEWSPAGNPAAKCVAVFGTQAPAGVSCTG